jgi:hypothetical protein
MTTLPRRRFLRALLLGIGALWLAATLAATERDALKLLTIGNSFADNALAELRPIARAAGKELTYLRANIGGCSLERHARHLRQAEAGEPEGRAYKNIIDPLTGDRRDFTLPEALAHLPWDVVTIQQVSHSSYKRETFQPHADELLEAIRRYAPTAEIVIHQTWAYRDDHPFFQGEDGFTAAKMHAGLRENYDWLAAEKGLRLLPSGEAMHLARQTPRWNYTPDPSFDFANPPTGQLPDQAGSLHVGWTWGTNRESGEPEFRLDAIHANTAGCYLAGVVWYRSLFGADAAPANYLPKGLSAEEAADLQSHAAAALATVARSSQMTAELVAP